MLNFETKSANLYVIQLGDFDSDTYKAGMLQLDQLLPQRVLSQYEMTPEMWEDRIQVWWVNNRGLSRLFTIVSTL